MDCSDKRVLVALSGGVDSSVCVQLLRRQGYEVKALVLRFSDAHDKAVAEAQTAARQLGVPLTVEDCSALFERSVIEPFCREYCAGRTPNPCLICNPLVKFKGLMAAADAYGFQMVATGHYAGLRKDGERVLLTMGENKARDQSYMLCRLTQKELKRLEAEKIAKEKETQESATVSGGSSGSSSSGSSSGSTSVSGNSSTGRAIANYALQFVGNPYVLGGTSLTNGADCSGFTQSVMAHFGISIPRTSDAQGRAGREVSYSEAQAGDIIYYGGHVAIYLGGGRIVHASTEATGIKTGTATYRTIRSVRRYY